MPFKSDTKILLMEIPIKLYFCTEQADPSEKNQAWFGFT
jgi:hypothetical protein